MFCQSDAMNWTSGPNQNTLAPSLDDARLQVVYPYHQLPLRVHRVLVCVLLHGPTLGTVFCVSRLGSSRCFWSTGKSVAPGDAGSGGSHDGFIPGPPDLLLLSAAQSARAAPVAQHTPCFARIAIGGLARSIWTLACGGARLKSGDQPMPLIRRLQPFATVLTNYSLSVSFDGLHVDPAATRGEVQCN